MTRNLQARITKLELGQRTYQETYEDWTQRIAAMPPMTEVEQADFDIEIEQEAIADFGSFNAAAEAARAEANRTRSPLDGLLAADRECRAADEIFAAAGQAIDQASTRMPPRNTP